MTHKSTKSIFEKNPEKMERIVSELYNKLRETEVYANHYSEEELKAYIRTQLKIVDKYTTEKVVWETQYLLRFFPEYSDSN